MDKCDTGTLAADTRLQVDQPCSLRGQMLKSQLDVGDCERDVMHPLAPGFDEATHRSVGFERLEQLDV